MAITDYLEGMNDPRLKPRLLRSLVRDRLPEESGPAPSPSELSSILASIKTHSLLSEHVPDLSDAKLIEAWRTAVDAWIERVLSLASSKMPDKLWVGVSLLGVSCEECSSARFMASYSLWFQKLLLGIQIPSSSSFVKVAVCASLSDFFTRLTGFSNLKKDATNLSGKVILLVLELLNESESDAVLEGVLDLLYVILMFFPPVHRHYDNVEAALVSKILSAKSNADLSRKIARCLALLPRIKGDEDSWSIMMQKIIIEIDMLLSNALEGLEGETKGSTVVRLLIPPGKDPPSRLGVQSRLREASELPTKMFHELIFPTISTLMHCCCLMLTNPFPTQVSVPVRPLVAMLGRVLTVDGSVRGSFMPFTTVMHQELICVELPALHLDTLDLLIAVVKGVRSQLLPHAANVARILTEYFRRATLPAIRIKLYSVIQLLLISMGVGMALYLAQELINNAFVDLIDNPGSNALLPRKHLSDDQSLLQSSLKKRKHASGSTRQHSNGIDRERTVISIKPATPLSVKIAALEALEALLTAGGSLRSECWRSDMDLLLINVAKNAYDVRSDYYKCLDANVGSTISRENLQLAALRALLASLLSPSHVRPPYLSEGLELFRQGKLETGTELAGFCAHALLALEVLIHPRALPLVDFQVSTSSALDEGFIKTFPGNTFRSSQKPSIPYFPMGNRGAAEEMDEDDDDDLLNGWLGAGEEEQPVQGLNISMGEKHVGVDSTRGHEIIEGTQQPSRKHEVEASCPSKEENMVESDKMEELNSGNNVMLRTDRTAPDEGEAAIRDVPGDEMAHENNDVSMSNTVAGEFSSNLGAPEELGTVSTATVVAVDASNSLDVSYKQKEPMLAYDSDSVSLDSLPDIVDADPDTD
uniref:Pre-rRNA-processing protein RIX1 N-terminal domain-containing protein n=1 Tax=Musa acuminata subsp. malaccensis TaxID=214687 RepID=A0A804JCJ9_MUSAM|nr:PREDICTED: proline-, glutamic acid- and leucine-rich protein 1 [Musa acuminata subsp. malaccensis]XP_018683559.1 PREDICTED: proline-, glutamic acid- and leucine-rich protein 1 [Musa acuminata subsp. malaccensis]